MKHTKIAIIGAGNVGSTIAYACMLQNIGAEITLTDINNDFCLGQVIDLQDVLAFSHTSQIACSSFKDAGQSDIIIICGGAKQATDQKRTDLIQTNQKVIHHIFEQIKPIRSDAIIIMVTNPVDIMTLYAQRISNHPTHLLFGSGTYLDSQRLRGYIAQMVNIAPESIDAYMLAEHGDSEFAAWSAVRIGGNPIQSFAALTPSVVTNIENNVRNKAYEIIKLKCATYFGIAACIASICKTIIFDEKTVLPLSVYHEKYNLCFSMPVVLGSQGIEKISDILLNADENKALEQSIQTIKNDSLSLI